MSEWRDIETAPKNGSASFCVPLGHGLFAVVDHEDSAIVFPGSWHARPRRDGKGWYAVNSAGKRMHRLLLDATAEEVVDHINGDGLDNRRCNLRIGTQSQNCVNRLTTPGPHKRGTRPKKGKWQAYIKYRGKQRSLGYFDTENEAHEAYLEAAKRLHGDWMPLPTQPEQER